MGKKNIRISSLAPKPTVNGKLKKEGCTSQCMGITCFPIRATLVTFTSAKWRDPFTTRTWFVRRHWSSYLGGKTYNVFVCTPGFPVWGSPIRGWLVSSPWSHHCSRVSCIQVAVVDHGTYSWVDSYLSQVACKIPSSKSWSVNARE